MTKGNAHLLNASIAKRMRELRLDVAGKLYARSLAPYAKLPHRMELEIHARNALKAAQVLLDVEQPTPPKAQPRDPLHPAAREALVIWMELSHAMTCVVPSVPIETLLHAMGNAMQKVAQHVRTPE